MTETIVVGYDRTESSDAALAWAAGEAAARGARLEVLHAWSRPQHVLARPDEDPESARQARREQIEAEVRGAIDPATIARIPEVVVVVAADDRPAALLTEASARASLVVVGSRGLSPSVAHVLHSVGQQLVETARCPLVIIPPKGRERATSQFSADALAAARAEALG